jgi:hypothetical protein
VTKPSSEAEPDYPAAKKYKGGIAQGYLDRRENHPTWEWEQAEVKRFVTSRPHALTVLDVPLGTGRYVPIYLEHGWKVLGSDISADMVAEAERSLGADAFRQCDIRVAPAESLPWPDNSVNVILSSRFIQWLPELRHVDRVIAEFGRIGAGELFLQLRIPAEPRQKPETEGPISAVKRLARRVRGKAVAAPQKARIVTHPEPELLAITGRHGWKLEEIGVECPTSRGLRFYRFSR